MIVEIFNILSYNIDMNNTVSWYSKLIKPTWAPPSFLFGPVWTVLYIIITISFFDNLQYLLLSITFLFNPS